MAFSEFHCHIDIREGGTKKCFKKTRGLSESTHHRVEHKKCVKNKGCFRGLLLMQCCPLLVRCKYCRDICGKALESYETILVCLYELEKSCLTIFHLKPQVYILRYTVLKDILGILRHIQPVKRKHCLIFLCFNETNSLEFLTLS